MSPGLDRRCEAVVIGGSAGATPVLVDLVSTLPRDYPVPIIVCIHLHASDDGGYAALLDSRCARPVVEAEDKLPIVPGNVYLAPANYHLLIELDRTLSLTVDDKVLSCRPSIDVLFESAAPVFRAALVGVLLSGSGSDGARGLRHIASLGGLTMVQDPSTAERPEMPLAAMDLHAVDLIRSPEEIRSDLLRMRP